jgi:hypothetical protein
MKPPYDQSSSVGRGVGVLLSRTRALSNSVTRWSRSASDRGDNAADVAVLQQQSQETATPGLSSPSGRSTLVEKQLPGALDGKQSSSASTAINISSGPLRTTSWKVKSSIRAPKARFASGRLELMALVESRKLRNVRESKITELVEREGYLADVEFDNKGLSLDELQVAAVLMLDRAAPCAAFADKAGLISLFEFVDSVRAVYKPNPYHDFRHAVDVMQFMNHMLSRDDVVSRVLAPEQGFSCSGDELRFMLLVACLCHDAGHDGTSNLFQRKANTELFEKYGPESTLERLHAAHAENLIESSNILDILKTVPNVVMDSTQFLEQVRSLILATDMEKHAAIVAAFKASPTAQLLNMLIKISDISNVIRGFEEAKVWAKRLEAEMKSAAARLPSDGPAAAPVPLAQSVIGFSKMFAIPLIDSLKEAGLQETARQLRARVEKNIAEWDKFSENTFNPGL